MPPVYDDELPAPGPIFGEPPVDVGPLYVPTDLYRVQALSQITRYPGDGRAIPTIDTSFQVADTWGSHELYIDNYAFTYADPLRDLRGRAKRILRLYALPNPPPPDPEEL